MTGGGGSVILINQRYFLSSEIKEISVPKNLEVVWVKAMPKNKMQVKIFILCGIYSKPSSKTKTILNDHIATSYHLLKTKYQDARFIFLGDFNDHKPDLILQLSPQLRQIVQYATYGTRTLDLLITDLHVLYHPPIGDPPLLPDDPNQAVQSDHLGNLFLPRTAQGIKNNRQYKTITVRPMKKAQIDALGKVLVNEKWHNVLNKPNVDEKLDIFSSSLQALLDEVAPLKQIKIACDDPAWMNARIKTAIRQRNREFEKNKKSEKWKQLKRKCKLMCKNAKKNFANKFIDNLKDKDPRSWMTAMKKLGRANHEVENDTWHFENETKSDQDITNEISEFFAKISSNFSPVDRTLLPLIPPPYSPFVSEVPNIPEEHEIFSLLSSSKKTASVPNDLPVSFVKEFTPELSLPVWDIFKSAITTGIYPTRWKTEYVSPHPKTLPPASYEDLRNLSMTEFLSKSFERFLLRGTASVKGLLHYIVQYWDPHQYAVPGASCNHALIKLIDFILANTDDCAKPTAVVNLLADWSKAFNKCNHNIIMRILVAMKVPFWLLRLIISYLEGRKMIVRFRGCSSHPELLPGGMPQGTLIGVILYILYINPVGFPSEITLEISDLVHQYWKNLDSFPPHIPSSATLPTTVQSIKFMDDATIQEAVNLTTKLVPANDGLGSKILPKERTEIQNQVNLIKKLSDDREMTLNSDKTCLFIVNFTKNHQFLPNIQIPGILKNLNVIPETKLLGYWLSEDMKTDKHIKYLLQIAYKKMWAISKLSKAGISITDIIHFFNIKIRSILESNCPVYHSMITKEQSDDIERLQKILLRIILKDNYISYHLACKHLNIQTLEQRRSDLCLKFALKISENPKFKDFFQPNTNTNNFRNQEKYFVPFAKSSRYKNSPRIFLTRLLNEYFKNNKTI